MARSPRELVVNITSDVTEFVRGTQDAGRATSSFVTDAKQDFGKVETAARDMADDTETHFDNMAREAKKSFHKIGTDASHEMAGPDVKGSFGEAGSEVGAEFASNLGESLSSGDLSAVATDTAGGLVSAFTMIGGPIGLALAGVAAGGAALFQHMQQQAAEATARIGALFEAMTEDAMGKLSETFRGQELQQAIRDLGGGDLGKGWIKFKADAERAGVPVQTLVDDFIKGGDALQDQVKQLGGVEAAGTRVRNVGRGVNEQLTASARAAQTTAGHLSKWNNEVIAADSAASSFTATVNGTNRVTSGVLTSISGWRTEVNASVAALRNANAQAVQLDRNLQNAGRSAATVRSNMQAAAGQSLGGRTRL